jgi:hypothetical protein
MLSDERETVCCCLWRPYRNKERERERERERENSALGCSGRTGCTGHAWAATFTVQPNTNNESTIDCCIVNCIAIDSRSYRCVDSAIACQASNFFINLNPRFQAEHDQGQEQVDEDQEDGDKQKAQMTLMCLCQDPLSFNLVFCVY